MKKIILLLLLMLTTVSNTTFAEQIKTGKLPIIVEARQLTYDKNKHKAIYIGNVIVQKGNITITGDKLILYFDKTGKLVEKTVMTGNVKFKGPQGEGTCKELEYFPGQEKIILIGDAKLKQKKNIIIGDRIIAFKNGNVTVEGIKQKVKTIIFPGENRNGTGK